MNATKGIGFVVIFFAVAGIIYYLSRPSYPKISPRAYECATALYSACNQQTPEKLDVLAELIDQSRAENEIRVEESKWMHAIIDQARSGRWQKAVAECRVLLDCQVDKDISLAVATD